MYKVVPGPQRPYDFPDLVQIAITYELDRDLRIIRRKVYGLLDFLGDLGGLAGALRGIFTVAIILFQYKATISYISNHTYLIKDGDEARSGNSTKIDTPNNADANHFKRIPIGFFSSIKLSFQRLICICKKCHSRRDKLSHASDRMVKEELKIVGWV